MPFALLLIGLVLVITSAQDTYVALGRQVRKDFTGNGSFLWWMIAIVMVGAIGYIEKLRGFATAFMALILIVLVLKNKGAFTGFVSALKKGPIAPAGGTAEPQVSGSSSIGQNVGSSAPSIGSSGAGQGLSTSGLAAAGSSAISNFSWVDLLALF